MTIKLLVILLYVAFLSSCSNESAFSNTSSRATPSDSGITTAQIDSSTSSDEMAADASKAEGGSDSSSGTNETSTAAKEAAIATLGKCIENWQTTQFSQEEIAAAAENVITLFNANNTINYSDNTNTDTPALKLIKIDAKNMNQGSIELLNSNGWYCVEISGHVYNNFIFRKNCAAQIDIINQDGQRMNNFTVDEVGSCLSN